MDPRRHNHLGLFNVSALRANVLTTFFVRMIFVKEFGIGKFFRKNFRFLYRLELIYDPESGYHPEIFEDKSSDILLLGYWQSFKYFENIKDLLREEFRLKSSSISKKNHELISEIKKEKSVAIHIRRGDYVSDNFFLENLGVCSLKYYLNAINHIVQRVADPCFYIFSDDPDWVMKNLKIDHRHYFVTHNLGKSDYEDFRLMNACNHFIIANSSFSWWAAWLADGIDKIVLAPDQWFVKDPMPIEDRIPASWIRISSS